MFRHMQNSEIIRKMTEEFDEVGILKLSLSICLHPFVYSVCLHTFACIVSQNVKDVGREFYFTDIYFFLNLFCLATVGQRRLSVDYVRATVEEV